MNYDEENKNKDNDDIDFGTGDDIDDFMISPQDNSKGGDSNVDDLDNKDEEEKNSAEEDAEEENSEEENSGEDGEEEKKRSAVQGDFITLPKSKIILVKKLLSNIKENNERLAQIFSDFAADENEISIGISQLGDDNKLDYQEQNEGKVIEGVFDGEQMIGPDGKQYSVPANYASKSKLVEGDIMKLTIMANGTFIFKQIGPIERNRIVATLERTSEGNFIASLDGKKWRLLTASITYYRGEPGDEVVIMVPKHGESKWAAVDNVVKKVSAY